MFATVDFVAGVLPTAPLIAAGGALFALDGGFQENGVFTLLLAGIFPVTPIMPGGTFSALPLTAGDGNLDALL